MRKIFLSYKLIATNILPGFNMCENEEIEAIVFCLKYSRKITHHCVYIINFQKKKKILSIILLTF